MLAIHQQPRALGGKHRLYRYGEPYVVECKNGRKETVTPSEIVGEFDTAEAAKAAKSELEAQ